MRYKPTKKKKVSEFNFKERILQLVFIWCVVILCSFGLIFVGLQIHYEVTCSKYVNDMVLSVFNIDKKEYSLVEKDCEWNQAKDRVDLVDFRLKSKESGNTFRVVDKTDECGVDGCDYELCISAEKRDGFYTRLTDYVCNNRVFSDGGAINAPLELQRRECYMFFEKDMGNRTVFSAFFPKGVGVIRLEKGNMEC